MSSQNGGGKSPDDHFMGEFVLPSEKVEKVSYNFGIGKEGTFVSVPPLDIALVSAV